ncbi:MAG: tRNA 2-thiouridine(34) synthase MnmA [Prevotellaceae bacterium]|jgi:tRNA-specific 2-thiouridylase|nr:tRNA 2-thiouridine(34) synthase MnmA [Prevotellaceae bacterium]
MKIAVGLSGGVDSSVAALLLTRQGHEVTALFMQNWHDTTGTLYGDCGWKDDRAIAELVAKKLHIPFHFVDLSNDYRQKVIDYMFAEYARGRTPNPDILCNREIKFDIFLKTAIALGAESVATGHYARIGRAGRAEAGRSAFTLLAGIDSNKDQSYFLCQLSQEQLSRALFPIGHLRKPDVRRLAAEAGLPTADKKDSQGLCFVGKIDLPVFLQQKLAAATGDIIEIDPSFYDGLPRDASLESLCAPYRYGVHSGKKIGEHRGAHFFTIGQRKGLGIGGRAESLFVIATDVEKNIIFVGEGAQHPGLLRRGLRVAAADVHWIRPETAMLPGEERRYMVRIRYRQLLQAATLYRKTDGLYIVFDNSQRGITPGQFAAWYSGDELVGSGVIEL